MNKDGKQIPGYITPDARELSLNISSILCASAGGQQPGGGGSLNKSRKSYDYSEYEEEYY